MRFSRLFLTAGQNVVPLSGWFLGGWSPGTTLVVFWFENLFLTLAIAVRIAAHWHATRTVGHTNGFLKNFLTIALVFTLAHGIFVGYVVGVMLPDSLSRADVLDGLQWMLAVGIAALAWDLWFIGSWPFAEIRARTDWMLGRVVLVHLSILGGMFLFAAAGQPRWFFSIFVGLKALMDVGSLLPRWQVREPPGWMADGFDRFGKGKDGESFRGYWRRVSAEEARKHARDEEIAPGA